MVVLVSISNENATAPLTQNDFRRFDLPAKCTPHAVRVITVHTYICVLRSANTNKKIVAV